MIILSDIFTVLQLIAVTERDRKPIVRDVLLLLLVYCLLGFH